MYLLQDSLSSDDRTDVRF